MPGSLLTINPSTGRLGDFTADQHPSVLSAWDGGELMLPAGAMHFGFVARGSAVLSWVKGQFTLAARMYFSVPGPASIGGPGWGFVASRCDYDGFFHVGGPIESRGRLRYIDGCTASLLIAPVVKGDPCLNLLYIPPTTDQTPHTHPSLRAGAVIEGGGFCRTQAADIPLEAGRIFVIPPNSLHSFHTAADSMLLIAWHPDSDFGPTHQEHPMLNRTLVDGHPILHRDKP